MSADAARHVLLSRVRGLFQASVTCFASARAIRRSSAPFTWLGSSVRGMPDRNGMCCPALSDVLQIATGTTWIARKRGTRGDEVACPPLSRLDRYRGCRETS